MIVKLMYQNFYLLINVSFMYTHGK
uniref:Uncharacterized protein n=1 Tax=Rhizophora mucronata TaxID=61149 RepID=A0A2P2QY81_RHIMU